MKAVVAFDIAFVLSTLTITSAEDLSRQRSVAYLAGMGSFSKETAGALLTEFVSLEPFVEENLVNPFADNIAVSEEKAHDPVLHGESETPRKMSFESQT